MIKTARDIIKRPVISEKSMAGIPSKRYTFRVDKSANKIAIAKAVEEIFNVKVAKVNTISVRGRAKRVGVHAGYQSDWKKAIVTLADSSKPIEFFESMV